MIIYFVLIGVTIFMMNLAQTSKSSIISKTQLLLVFAILVLFAGLRSGDVGTDTNNYIGSFSSFRVATTNFLDSTSSIEIGYLFIEKMCRILSDQYWVLLIVIAFISIYFNLKTIIKLSINYRLSVFVYISLGIYLFFFNGARQGLAASIYAMALISLVHGNFKKYVLWVLIAALFHKTVLITIPAYFILRTKYSLKKVIFALFISLILISSWVYLIKFFPGFISDRYLVYNNRGATGGISLTIFFLFITLSFIIIRKYISLKDKSIYDLYLNISIFHTLIFVIITLSGEDINMLRFAHYFSFGFVLIWPIIFRNLRFFKQLFPKIIFATVHLVFLYIYLSKMSDLTPYQLNPNLF